MTKKTKYLLLLIAAALVVWFTWDAFNQPGVQDLKGGFEEVAFYRNENNTGPITRVFAVTVADTLWREMRQYGDLMPYTKYGTTKVYFFRQGQPVPKVVQPGEVNFGSEFNKYCLAKYDKGVMSDVSFKRYPLQ